MTRCFAFFTILAGIFMSVLMACATSPTGRSQLIIIPEDQMAQMGVTAFSRLKQEGDLSRDRRVNNYVECVSRNVVAALPGANNNQRWEVVVFDNEEPNAFALPGGKIGVHSGILKVARNQHQLATVIGHEIAHVQSQHGAERVSQQFAAQAALGLVQAYSASRDRPREEQQMLLGLLGLGAQVGVLLPYARTHESEADIVGLKLMAEAGFDPRASVELWQNMKAASRGAPPEFLSTHPHPDNRMRQLHNYMPQAERIAADARRRGRTPNCRL